MFYKLIYKIACLTSILITLLTLFSFFGRYPYFELSTHFRLQYLWLSFIGVIFFGVFRDWKLIFSCLICFVFNAIFILPYYVFDNHQVKDTPTINLRLMLANVEGNNINYDKLIESVKSANPDIIILQEITDKWWQQIEILKMIYPNFKAFPRQGGSGLVIFSRFLIEQADVLTLDSSTQPALFNKINLDGKIITILTIHPPTPMRGDKFANRNEQFAQSALIMKSAPEPKLLIGDLNTTMWSPYFTELVEDSGLRDVRKGRGLLTSWHSLLPNFLRISLDHCLVSETIEVENVELGNFTGSDHFPLIVDLKIEKN